MLVTVLVCVLSCRTVDYDPVERKEVRMHIYASFQFVLCKFGVK